MIPVRESRLVGVDIHTTNPVHCGRSARNCRWSCQVGPRRRSSELYGQNRESDCPCSLPTGSASPAAGNLTRLSYVAYIFPGPVTSAVRDREQWVSPFAFFAFSFAPPILLVGTVGVPFCSARSASVGAARSSTGRIGCLSVRVRSRPAPHHRLPANCPVLLMLPMFFWAGHVSGP